MNSVNYGRLTTEQRNPRTANFDRLSASELVIRMNHEDRRVFQAIRNSQAQIARAILLITNALRGGGRLFFVGAGTSGRLGVIEAAECPPTFNSRPQQIQAIMAGGPTAVFRSKEGSEDSEREGASQIRRRVRAGDAVVGIAASGVTPFVGAALHRARKQGARTVLLTCNPAAREIVDVRIALLTGPEVLTGSTRLKAGTACKMVLNMLTTGAMVQLGKVYGNRMVDLQPKSKKLVARAIRLIAEVAKVDFQTAARLFKASNRHAKVAIVMGVQRVTDVEARRLLRKANGFLRTALKEKR